MAKLLYVILLCVVSQSLGQCNFDQAKLPLKKISYDFSVDILTRIAEETESHFVASPLSIWTLISSLSTVSAGTTRSEINKVLYLKPNRCFNDKFFAIVKSITTQSHDATLERSSAIYIDDKLNVKPDIKSKFQTAGVVDVSVISFANFDSVASTINNHVSVATHGAIDEVVSPSDLEGVYVILIDTIYFKGRWRLPFLPENTETSPFYNENRQQIGDISQMYLMGKFNVCNIDLIGAKILELPYGNDDNFSMLIFLPHKGVSLFSVIQKLKSIRLTTIFKSFDRKGIDNIIVQIPRFKISSELDNLKELLSDMGLQAMFDSSQAKFPGISDYDLYVSKLIQKANIEVTEEGTVASAVTDAEFESRILPDEFVVNKPFLYMIVHRSVQIPLFVGAYSKPSTY